MLQIKKPSKAKLIPNNGLELEHSLRNGKYGCEVIMTARHYESPPADMITISTVQQLKQTDNIITTLGDIQ